MNQLGFFFSSQCQEHLLEIIVVDGDIWIKLKGLFIGLQGLTVTFQLHQGRHTLFGSAAPALFFLVAKKGGLKREEVALGTAVYSNQEMMDLIVLIRECDWCNCPRISIHSKRNTTI